MADTAEQIPTAGTPPQAQPAPEQPQPEKTFTQAELDRIVRERLARQKEQYADYDTLKADAEQYRQAQEARKSAEQKLAEQLKAAEQRAAEVERTAQERLLRAEIIAQAAALNFAAPADAYALLDKSSLTPDESGNFNGIGEALKALAEAKPYLLKTRAPQVNPTNPNQGQPPAETPEQRRARIYGSGGNLFDPAAARNQGGGVQFPVPPK